MLHLPGTARLGEVDVDVLLEDIGRALVDHCGAGSFFGGWVRVGVVERKTVLEKSEGRGRGRSCVTRVTFVLVENAVRANLVLRRDGLRGGGDQTGVSFVS